MVERIQRTEFLGPTPSDFLSDGKGLAISRQRCWRPSFGRSTLASPMRSASRPRLVGFWCFFWVDFCDCNFSFCISIYVWYIYIYIYIFPFWFKPDKGVDSWFFQDVKDAISLPELAGFLESVGISTDDVWTGPLGRQRGHGFGKKMRNNRCNAIALNSFFVGGRVCPCASKWYLDICGWGCLDCWWPIVLAGPSSCC